MLDAGAVWSQTILLSDDLKGLSLYLIGMMGSGKTTVGRMLAEQLQYHFFDTDALIEQTTQQSISEIFATSGEANFRTLESQVLSELSAYKRLVIATGGGIVLQQMNWSYLRHGLIIWLDVPIDQLFDRLAEDTTRPLLQDPDPKQKLQTILEQRQSLYAQADLRIPVSIGESPEQVITHILSAIPTVLRADLNASTSHDSLN